MQNRILFVADEPNVLDDLKRMLQPRRATWVMDFAGNCAEALATLTQQHFDVVVSDLRLPGITGRELLSTIRERYPNIVQISLSGGDDTITKTVQPNFQFLAKSCDLDRLTLAVNRACAVRALLANEPLKLLVSQLTALPTLPALYTELMAELQSSNSSIKKIAQIVACDLGMTAKILQIANSAFFGLRRHISSPVDAVNLLGLDAVVSMALSVQLFSRYKSEQIPGFSATKIWNHSLRVGWTAKHIAQAEKQDNEVVKDAFTAGLLHDAGKLVLATEQTQAYQEMLKLTQTEGLSIKDAERRVFGATHGEVGAYLLGLWGLSNAIVGAVAFHHEPASAQTQRFCPLTAVHIANALDREKQPHRSVPFQPAFELDYLSSLGLEGRLPAWTDIYRQAAAAA